MSIPLTVRSKVYNYPEQGEDPIWGEEATGWAEAVTDVLADVVGPGDILQTAFSVANNQVAPAEVTGLLLDTGVVRSAVIDCSVYRVSTAQPYGHAENFTIYAIYDNSAPVNSKWSISIEANMNSGVTLDINDLGQFTYTSTDIGTLGYNGTMRFRSRSITSF